jgi:hypothetical protein
MIAPNAATAAAWGAGRVRRDERGKGPAYRKLGRVVVDDQN